MKPSEIAEHDLFSADNERVSLQDMKRVFRAYLRPREAGLEVKKYGVPNDSHRILGDYVVPRECIEELVDALKEHDESEPKQPLDSAPEPLKEIP